MHSEVVTYFALVILCLAASECGPDSLNEETCRAGASAEMKVSSVTSIPISEMTRQRFESEFASRRGVLINGAWPHPDSHLSGFNWSAGAVAAACPDGKIQVYAHEQDSDTWAALAHKGEMNVREYYSRYLDVTPGKRPKPLLYGFGMPLKSHCPALLENTSLPDFLTEDAVHFVTDGRGDSFPTILMGPAQSKTSLHIDSHRMPIWIAVVGRPGSILKRIRFFNVDDPVVFEYATKTQTTKQGRRIAGSSARFSFDPWNVDFAESPGLRSTSMYEVDMRSGDLLYLPGGTPYAILNLEDNLALAMNFVDAKTIPDFKAYCDCCMPESDLCNQLLYGMYDVADIKQHFYLQRNEAQTLVPYYQFAGVINRKGFCKLHVNQLLPEFPALLEYCGGVNTLGELCGKAKRTLPSIHMIHLKNRPDRIGFVRNNTVEPVLKHIQFFEGVDFRGSSQEAVLKLMREKSWHPAPSFNILQNLKQYGSAGEAMRQKILGRRLGFRDGEQPIDEEDRQSWIDQSAFIEKYYDRERRIGEIGNGASHHMVWKRISQEGAQLDWAIVLEDDVAVFDVEGLCNLINRIDSLPKVGKKRNWDFINVHPKGGRASPERWKELDRDESNDGSFQRVRSSMALHFYAVTADYARYLETAGFENCLMGADEFTTFSCDPASHFMREAFGACWPRLTQQRMCLDYTITSSRYSDYPQPFYKFPRGDAATSSIESTSRIKVIDLALLRHELGTDERIKSPFSHLQTNTTESSSTYEGKPKQLGKDANASSRAWNYSSVDRRTTDLSYDEFVTEYLLPRRAVVIEGLAKKMLPRHWGWDFLKKQCEFSGVRLYNYRPKQTSAEGNTFFADLVATTNEIALADYMDDIEAGLAGQDSQFYRQRSLVFDAYLQGCGLENFTYPKYVTNDFLKRSKMNGKEDDPFYAQPSLFLGVNHATKGPSGGGLHRDAYASHFWQALAEGRKEWVVICGLHPERRQQVLYPHQANMRKGETDPQNYRLNAFKPDFKKFPLAEDVFQTNIARFVVNAGDFVFIPADCPHQARSLSSRSVALSQNFVDNTNVADFLQEVAHYGGREKLVVALQQAMEENPPPFLRDPPDLRLQEHHTYGAPRPWEDETAILRI